MATGEKASFDKWVKGVYEYLNDRYTELGLYPEFEFFEKRHWKELWKIFRSSSLGGSGKEWSEALDYADHEAGEVILEAHGMTYDKLDWQEQMDHYMNSRNYD